MLGCYHFHESKDFPYMSVMGASKELGVSESTVSRWVKKGKLKGRLFVQERSCFVLSLLGIILKGKV